MTRFKHCSTAVALLVMSSAAAVAQESGAGSVTLLGQGTGVMYEVPVGMAAHLCGVDASQLTQTAAMLTGAFANSRLVLCEVAQEVIDQNNFARVEFVESTDDADGQTAEGGAGEADGTDAASGAEAGGDAAAGGNADSGAGADAGGAADAAVNAESMVRISVGGAIVEVTPEQAAEACGIDIETLRADVAALEAGAGDPVSPDETDATDAAAGTEAAGVSADADAAANGDEAEDGTVAGAEETDPDATTTNDETAMADDGGAGGAESTDTSAEATDTAVNTAQAADSAPQVEGEDTTDVSNAELEAAADPEVPVPTADAVCEISRDMAEELGLPAPD